jgi:hypothetical protein
VFERGLIRSKLHAERHRRDHAEEIVDVAHGQMDLRLCSLPTEIAVEAGDDVDAGDRLPGIHDRVDDALGRLRQCRNAVANRAAYVIGNGYAAYFREALIDL